MSLQHHDESYHSQGHSHVHGHEHGHGINYGRTFVLATLLNAAFIVVEVGCGFYANSLALLADAGHNLGDVLGLMLAWGAWLLSKKSASQKYTYGLRSTSIMAALINVITLLMAMGVIAYEAIQRIGSHTQIQSNFVISVAAVGILINGFSAWLFSKGQDDINIKAVFMHLLSDAVVSLGVVIAGFVIVFTGWLWVDPVTSLVIAVVIGVGSIGLLRDSANLALHAVPAHISYEKVAAYLSSLPNVQEVHDLHIWGLSTADVALSAHLVMPEGNGGDEFLSDISETMEETFGIGHTTVQIETGDVVHAECTAKHGCGKPRD